MHLALLLVASLWLPATSARASGNAVHDACRRLCDADSECTRKCSAHAELFELKADFILAAAGFHPNHDTRMQVLRSGADLQVLELCKGTGWSLDNQLTCLRSYPTPEVIKNCKKLSPRQEEQVNCVRLGKTGAQIEACLNLVPGSDTRLACLGMKISAGDADRCGEEGGNSTQRMSCLRAAEASRRDHGQVEQSVRRELDRRERENARQRHPASVEP